MKNTTHTRILFIAQAGIIAALYVVFTHISNLMGLANQAIQVRISEAFCVLTFFTPAAIPGMTIGCFLANLSMGNPWMDVLIGTLASFIGAICGWLLRKVSVWLVPIPTVLANAILVPFVIKYAYMGEPLWGLQWYLGFFLSVGTGEIIAAYALGMILYFALRKRGDRIFRLR